MWGLNDEGHFAGWFLFSLWDRGESSPQSKEREGRDVGGKKRQRGYHI